MPPIMALRQGMAGRSDIQFALQWDRRCRQVVPEAIVLHLESEAAALRATGTAGRRNLSGRKARPSTRYRSRSQITATTTSTITTSIITTGTHKTAVRLAAWLVATAAGAIAAAALIRAVLAALSIATESETLIYVDRSNQRNPDDPDPARRPGRQLGRRGGRRGSSAAGRRNGKRHGRGRRDHAFRRPVESLHREPDPARTSSRRPNASARPRLATRRSRRLQAKGQIEQAFSLQRQQSEAELQAERTARRQTEERAKRYALDGELARALAAQPLVPGGATSSPGYGDDQFNVEPRGDSFHVQTAAFQTVDDFVKSQLGTPGYSHFLRPNNAAGGTVTGVQPQSTQTGQPVVDTQPKNLSEAILMSMRGKKDAPPANMTGGATWEGDTITRQGAAAFGLRPVPIGKG